MATTSLWHIEGRLKDLIAYVENPKKTVANNTSLQPLWEVMSYVSRPEATEQRMNGLCSYPTNTKWSVWN